MEALASKYIEKKLDIQLFTLENLQTETLTQLILGIEDFTTHISCIKPEIICSIPQKANKYDYSIYSGFGGYLYLYLKLYRFSLTLKDNTSIDFYKKRVYSFSKFQQIFDEDRLLNNCEKLSSFIQPLISFPIDKEKPPMISYFMGRSGILVLSVFLAFYSGNENRFNDAIKELKKVLDFTLVYKGEVFHEMLYGTCGLLYAFLEIQNSFQSCEIKSFRVDLKEEIYCLSRFIYFERYDKALKRFSVKICQEEYLGAAHGLFGLLYTLMKAYELTSEYLKEKDPEFEVFFIESLVKTMDFCLKLQYPSGNFPTNLDLNQSDEMLQYCHGSPGIIPALLLGNKVLNKFKPELAEKLMISAINAGEDLWKRGLLKKGFNLCHGISGNAFAFLSLFKRTKEEKWLKRAYVFAACKGLDDTLEPLINGYDSGVRLKVGLSDHPYSLMEGLAGHLCLLIDLDPRNVEKAKFPGLEV